jgi:hypothetical protein
VGGSGRRRDGCGSHGGSWDEEEIIKEDGCERS